MDRACDENDRAGYDRWEKMIDTKYCSHKDEQRGEGRSDGYSEEIPESI